MSFTEKLANLQKSYHQWVARYTASSRQPTAWDVGAARPVYEVLQGGWPLTFYEALASIDNGNASATIALPPAYQVGDSFLLVGLTFNYAIGAAVARTFLIEAESQFSLQVTRSNSTNLALSGAGMADFYGSAEPVLILPARDLASPLFTFHADAAIPAPTRAQIAVFGFTIPAGVRPKA